MKNSWSWECCLQDESSVGGKKNKENNKSKDLLEVCPTCQQVLMGCDLIPQVQSHSLEEINFMHLLNFRLYSPLLKNFSIVANFMSKFNYWNKGIYYQERMTRSRLSFLVMVKFKTSLNMILKDVRKECKSDCKMCKVSFWTIHCRLRESYWRGWSDISWLWQAALLVKKFQSNNLANRDEWPQNYVFLIFTRLRKTDLTSFCI